MAIRPHRLRRADQLRLAVVLRAENVQPHQGDEVLATAAQNLPTYTWQQPAKSATAWRSPAVTRKCKAIFLLPHATAKPATIVKVVNRAGHGAGGEN